jgi:hypothetical protein
MSVKIPTEPIGSIPRPRALIDEISRIGDGTDPEVAFAKIRARVESQPAGNR